MQLETWKPVASLQSHCVYFYIGLVLLATLVQSELFVSRTLLEYEVGGGYLRKEFWDS